jgi:hypothetical protein
VRELSLADINCSKLSFAVASYRRLLSPVGAVDHHHSSLFVVVRVRPSSAASHDPPELLLRWRAWVALRESSYSSEIFRLDKRP